MPPQKESTSSFLKNHKQYPILAGILAGLYPAIFYASNNFTLVNTWGHLGFFVITYIALPIALIVLTYQIVKRTPLRQYSHLIIPFFGTFFFLFFMHLAYYGELKKKITVGLILVAVLVAYFLWKQFKKIMILQGLMVIVGLFALYPRVMEAISNDTSWQGITDSIEDTAFVKKPNIYFIQPDGYVNFSELYRGHYKSKDSSFQKYLEGNEFKLYPDFRSNYASTLTSNSATFSMKHHFYNGGLSLETYNARNIIISDNAVLRTLKQNGYGTNFITELPYLLLNRPEMGYDYSNIDLNDVRYIGTGLGDKVDTYAPLRSRLENNLKNPQFYFIEIFAPGHIHGSPLKSEGIAGERNLWFESLKESTEKVTRHIDLILEKDPEALVVIMADHGGFVGMGSTSEVYAKIQERDKLYAVFSANLAIKWPENKEYGREHLKSAVNVFRVLFSYLSEEDQYLKNAENNASYLVIKEDAPQGVYEVIDTDGNITFKKQ